MSSFAYRWLDTPLGPLEIAVEDGQWLTYIEFKSQDELVDVTNSAANEILDITEAQLKQYFSGNRKTFSDLYPVLKVVGTEFQQACWGTLKQIPYGETCSYGEQANKMNNPKAVRAVGAANGQNPFAIVVPCHRVIGANGSLTGYAGGLDKKKWLLEFEATQ